MRKLSALFILVLFPFLTLLGQSNVPKLDSAEKKAVIDALCENLDREYIFPEITKKYVQLLKENLQSGKYDRFQQPQAFANEITNNLKAVHKDDHLSVQYDPGWIKGKRERKKKDEKAILLNKRRARSSNYGFKKIEILPGNIGYLRFDGFSYNEAAYNTAIGAINYLANADAVIIDLRRNGGGSPEMVQFLCSYFLANPRKHLNSFTYKDKEKNTQYWTYTYLPGKRLDKVDLYLLTSSRTFSAAEEFAYNLKHMKRAVVIGETTGGGAHDNKYVILTDNFMMSLPFARAVNPVTKSNWEGTGVEPDVKVSQDEALDTALVMAIKKLADKEEDPEFKSFYKWHYEAYHAKFNPVSIKKKVLRSYVGKYGPRKITLEGDSLYYQRGDRAKLKMIPLTEDYFKFREFDFFRLKFLVKDGKVIGVEGRGVNGPVDKNLKDK